MGYHDGQLSRVGEFGMTRESVTAWEAMVLIRVGLKRLELAGKQAEEELLEGRHPFGPELKRLARDASTTVPEIEAILKKEGLDQIVLPIEEADGTETVEKAKQLHDWTIT